MGGLRWMVADELTVIVFTCWRNALQLGIVILVVYIASSFAVNFAFVSLAPKLRCVWLTFHGAGLVACFACIRCKGSRLSVPVACVLCACTCGHVFMVVQPPVPALHVCSVHPTCTGVLGMVLCVICRRPGMFLVVCVLLAVGAAHVQWAEAPTTRLGNFSARQ